MTKRNIKSFPCNISRTMELTADSRILQSDKAYMELEVDGVTRLEGILAGDQLQGMQRAFDAQLRNMRWNNVDGYKRTERFRHMVEDILVIDQGFVDVALHPLVVDVIRRYIGPNFSLCEAKGWRSLTTKRNFHGWHADMWYDKTAVDFIPREVKLMIYLTDVTSGAFNYVKGTHRIEPPRNYDDEEITYELMTKNIEITGPAGTAVLFDTSGIHRQGSPILKPRNAVFFSYHDPKIRIQHVDQESNRYHPLILNAAFLGDLSEEDQRVLGFGEKAQYRAHIACSSQFKMFGNAVELIHGMSILWQDFVARARSRLKSQLSKK